MDWHTKLRHICSTKSRPTAGSRRSVVVAHWPPRGPHAPGHGQRDRCLVPGTASERDQRHRDTGCPFCKWPSTASSLFTDRRPLMGRGPVRGSPWGPRAWHWRALPLRFCHFLEIGSSTLPHETKHSSDALKHPRIRRAVSTLVYATPLHPAQGHLPVILHPPNSAVFWAGGLAGACRRRPCSSRFNRQDDHPRGCTAGPSRT